MFLGDLMNQYFFLACEGLPALWKFVVLVLLELNSGVASGVTFSYSSSQSMPHDDENAVESGIYVNTWTEHT